MVRKTGDSKEWDSYLLLTSIKLPNELLRLRLRVVPPELRELTGGDMVSLAGSIPFKPYYIKKGL